uniref:Uncharacterized protein n=1 Tax=Panagrellus redivivus TaxID=6233 RepID=A0A7E4W5W5_PANRE
MASRDEHVKDGWGGRRRLPEGSHRSLNKPGEGEPRPWWDDVFGWPWAGVPPGKGSIRPPPSDEGEGQKRLDPRKALRQRHVLKCHFSSGRRQFSPPGWPVGLSRVVTSDEWGLGLGDKNDKHKKARNERGSQVSVKQAHTEGGLRRSHLGKTAA